MAKQKQFDTAKLAIVPIDNVEVNGWNPKNKETAEYKKVVRSLELYGFRTPILVRDHPTEPKLYQILDGEQRFTAATELGYTEVPVYNLGKVSDEEAKAATIWMEVQVPFEEVDLSHLVVELNNLSVELPYSEAEIADFQRMAEFDFDQYEKEPLADEGTVKTLSIKMAEDQYQVIMETIKNVMDEMECNEARALEFIIAEFRAGHVFDSED